MKKTATALLWAALAGILPARAAHSRAVGSFGGIFASNLNSAARDKNPLATRLPHHRGRKRMRRSMVYCLLLHPIRDINIQII